MKHEIKDFPVTKKKKKNKRVEKDAQALHACGTVDNRSYRLGSDKQLKMDKIASKQENHEQRTSVSGTFNSGSSMAAANGWM